MRVELNITHLLISFAILVLSFAAPAHAGSKVLFYMHGSDMHGKSTDHKNAGNYKKVINSLKNEGFDVVYEFRTDRDEEAEATRTAEMVKDRIASGTAPQDIIVSGFSYGSMIALKTAGLLGNNKVNIALFCGCPEGSSIPVNIDYKAVKGKVFSIIDSDDDKYGSCKDRFPNVTDFTEKTITSGKGHNVFKLGKEKFINKWLPLFVNWAE